MAEEKVTHCGVEMTDVEVQAAMMRSAPGAAYDAAAQCLMSVPSENVVVSEPVTKVSLLQRIFGR